MIGFTYSRRYYIAKRHSRSSVRKISAVLSKELNDARIACRLRAELEIFAYSQIPASALPGLLARMEKELAKLRIHAQRSDYENFHLSDWAFHQAIIDGAGVELLRTMWVQTFGHLDAWGKEYFQTCWPSLMALFHEHVLLWEAIQSGNAVRIREGLKHHLEAVWQRMEFAVGKPPAEANAAERAAAFLSTHLEDNVSLTWLGRNVCFVSASHLNRLFREEFGMPPNRWLQRVRIERAAEMLRQSRALGVSEIGQAVGYRDASRFIAHFRRAYGITPKGYRNQHVQSA